MKVCRDLRPGPVWDEDRGVWTVPDVQVPDPVWDDEEGVWRLPGVCSGDAWYASADEYQTAISAHLAESDPEWTAKYVAEIDARSEAEPEERRLAEVARPILARRATPAAPVAASAVQVRGRSRESRPGGRRTGSRRTSSGRDGPRRRSSDSDDDPELDRKVAR